MTRSVIKRLKLNKMFLSKPTLLPANGTLVGNTAESVQQKPTDASVWNVSPDASLISRAVRIRAIRVEVKCTELSSAMGMFILTNRCEEPEATGIKIIKALSCTLM